MCIYFSCYPMIFSVTDNHLSQHGSMSHGVATGAVPTPKDVLSLPVHDTGPAVRALALRSVKIQSTPPDKTEPEKSPATSHLMDQKQHTGKSEDTNHLHSQIIDSQDKYRHLDPTTGNQVCNICEKQFKNLMSISAHLRRVHHISRKPIRKYTCSVCGRDFLLQSKLNSHMHTHKGKNEAVVY